METTLETTTNKAADAAKADTDFLEQLSEVNAIVKNATPTKVAKFVGKSLRASKDLNNFLNASQDEMLKKYVPVQFRSSDNVNKLLDDLYNEDKDTILVDTERTKKALAILNERFIDTDVQAKTTWLNSFNLSALGIEEQAAKQLAQYRRVLMLMVRNSEKYKELYGTK